MTRTPPHLTLLGPEIAQVFAELHRDHGVDLRTGVQIAEVTGGAGTADGVHLTDGSHLPADAVIAGVGIAPDDAPAADAGLKVDNGIVVDEHLQTSDPDIYAAGDVANGWATPERTRRRRFPRARPGRLRPRHHLLPRLPASADVADAPSRA